MLQVAFIRQNVDFVKERLSIRNFPETGLVDTIVALDDQPILNLAGLDRVLGGLHPGDKVSIRYVHHSTEKTAIVMLTENPAREVVTFESAGLPVTPAILQFRKSWLGPK